MRISAQRPAARTPTSARPNPYATASVDYSAPWLRTSHPHAGRTPRFVPAPVALAPVAGALAAAHNPLAAGHPLADPALTDGLRRRADAIDAAFAAVEPALRALAPQQFEEGFAARAHARLREQLGLALSPDALQAQWAAPLPMGTLHAHCVLGTFRRLVERGFDRSLAHLSEGENAATLIRRWGFHAVDLSPCADGRLSGVVDYILRVPPAVVAFRKSTAGALFDVEESLRHWESVELRRWRQGQPNAADAATRFLKIGVYHFSSVDPRHEGCAAHGSDAARASGALLERLQQFAQAVRHTHGPAADAATLLVGVDTDTDAIRVHVPDASGGIEIGRQVDAGQLYESTRPLSREAAKDAIRAAVAACAGVSPEDPGTEGMRWFCGYLLKNNLGQVDAVREQHGAHYPDRGHTERLIVVGDAIDDVQLRNLAFQAQLETVEEGAADLDVGVGILHRRHAPRHLAVPVLVHARHDPRIPGARERAARRALRLQAAIEARYAGTLGRSALHAQAVVRAGDGGPLADATAVLAGRDDPVAAAACGCGGAHPECRA
jgi:carboxysome shell carbonic anhydrase